MRKRLISLPLHNAAMEQAWLDVESIATVEVTSEEDSFPVESALSLSGKQGWRAAKPGVQAIRLVFDEPQRLSRISLDFVETEIQRMQEFSLRWSPDRGKSFQEIVQQQWNFSSPDATRETENYSVELSNVTLLDLTIKPDLENRKGRASLLSLRLA